MLQHTGNRCSLLWLIWCVMMASMRLAAVSVPSVERWRASPPATAAATAAGTVLVDTGGRLEFIALHVSTQFVN